MFYLTAIFIVYVIFLSTQLTVTAQSVNISEPVPPPAAVRKTFKLDPFYVQWLDVDGLPIVASAKVSPYAVKEAVWLIRQMVGHRQDVLQALAKNNVRFAVMAYNELTTQIPEHSDLQPDYYGTDAHAVWAPHHPDPLSVVVRRTCLITKAIRIRLKIFWCMSSRMRFTRWD